MIKTAFNFLFMTIALSAFSQLGPGYMGNRFLFSYGFHFSPAIIGSNGSESSMIGRGNATGGDMAFNSIHEGLVEFSFKNRTSIGLSCKYYNTTFDNNVYASSYTEVCNGYGGCYTISGLPSGFYQIKGLNYSLYFKFYGKRYVAPWGRYFLLGPTVDTYKCFYDPSTMRIYEGGTNSNIYINDFGPQGQFFARADLVCGWGRNRIVGKRIVIDYGINFQVVALAMGLSDLAGESILEIFDRSSVTNLNYFESTSKRRVREVNRVNAYLKIGFLLF